MVLGFSQSLEKLDLEIHSFGTGVGVGVRVGIGHSFCFEFVDYCSSACLEKSATFLFLGYIGLANQIQGFLPSTMLYFPNQ